MPQFASLGSWNLQAEYSERALTWLWDGIVARGNLTLLTSIWKSGKSTLVSLLLDRRREGGLLLGRRVEPGASVVISEEPKELWASRLRRLNFGDQVGFFCRPFEGVPDLLTWRGFIDHLLTLNRERGVDLVVIDPAAMFLPSNENNAASQLRALSEVRRLTEHDMAVLMLHHPPKGDTKLGQAARGTGALPAFADILLEMRVPPGSVTTRRRRLHGFARYEETPRHLLAELNREGTDYTVLAESDDQDILPAVFECACEVLRQSAAPLTREEILARWPAHEPLPKVNTLWRWLTRGCELGLLLRTGAGSKAEAFRYGLR